MHAHSCKVTQNATNEKLATIRSDEKMTLFHAKVSSYI